MEKRISDAQIELAFQGEHTWAPIVGKSRKWYNWIAMIDPRICPLCEERHGQIRTTPAAWVPKPPAHRYCRCRVDPMETIQAGTATIKWVNGADWWLLNKGKLPSYYINKRTARKLGWVKSKGNLHEKANGKQIGGDVFSNDKDKLPSAPGRIWYEADINYKSGYRNTHRILYSSDGLIFVTYDHYDTFFEIV